MTDPRLHTGVAQQGRGWVAWVVSSSIKVWPPIDRRAERTTEKAAREWVTEQVKQWKERADGQATDQ